MLALSFLQKSVKMHQLERKKLCITEKMILYVQSPMGSVKELLQLTSEFCKVSGYKDTLERTWTARRTDQSILKEIYPEDSLEGLMLNLKLLYFGYLM